MTDKNRILFLSANPWVNSRILVDEEARHIVERLHEGPFRDRFEFFIHPATRPEDLQRLLLTYQPHVVHFSGHGTKKQKLILAGPNGRGKTIDQQGLTNVFALYNNTVRLVLLNACFTKEQARSISEVVDYSIGTTRPIGDKASVAFAGAFYRALGFGKCVRESFESATAELALTKMQRSRGIVLFIKKGTDDKDRFPQIDTDRIIAVNRVKTIQQTVFVSEISRHAGAIPQERTSCPTGELCGVTAAPLTVNIRRMKVRKNVQQQEMRNELADKRTVNKSGRKAPGTRIGTLNDWREASISSKKVPGGYGRAVRDGR